MHLDAMDSPKGEVTRLLHAARDGDATAMDRIIHLLYDDLCAIAGRQLRREPFQRMTHPASLAILPFVAGILLCVVVYGRLQTGATANAYEAARRTA